MSRRDLAALPDEALLARVGVMLDAVDPVPSAARVVPVLPVEGCAQAALDQTLAAATEPVVYTIALPAGLPLLNANRTRRMHWAQVRKLAKPIREAACLVARSQRIPTLDRAHVVYVIHPSPQTRKRDPGNWAESAKAAVDGLVDAGVFADDDAAHVIGPDPRLGEPVKGGRLVIHITPIGGNS